MTNYAICYHSAAAAVEKLECGTVRTSPERLLGSQDDVHVYLREFILPCSF